MENTFHNNSLPLSPPPDGSSGRAGNSRVSTRLLPVLERAKGMYRQWMEIHRNMERSARFGMGNKIDILFLRILELLRKSMYAPVNKKVTLLEEASEGIDSFRFFFQLAWETKLVSNKHYASFAVEIENLGKIVGGWKKGIINKTSATSTRP